LFLATLKALVPIESRSHVQEVLDRDRLLSLIDVRHVAIGEEIKHGMIEAVEQAILSGDCNEAADDRLGGGIVDMGNVRGIGRVIGVQRDLAVAHDQEAVEALGLAEGDKRREISGALRMRAGAAQ
jgi:hypothetical protein